MNRRTSFVVMVAAACVLVIVIALGACGGDGKKDTEGAQNIAATPTTTAPPPVAPLTGLPDPGGAAGKRCAVTVKIDNTKFTQPKWGIDEADVVYEEVVEGGITRLAAVFNSKAPERVASVRSVRKTDQSLVAPVRGVFAYSGGAQYAIDSINTAPVVQLDETRAGDMMFRDDRDAPYDLNANVKAMYGKCQDPAPAPLFRYRKKGTPVAGDPASSGRVGFEAGFAVTWTWNDLGKVWTRTIFDQPEVAANGTPITARNVVVMFTTYVGGNSYGEGAEAALVGSGRAVVLTGGKAITGTWKRPDKAKAAVLLDATNREIQLGAGQTWVALPETTHTLDITP